MLRIRLLDFPLERDEGAFAYMGRLILDGIPPYTAAYDFKTPGLYATYALFIGLFGETASAIHLGLLILNLISIILVYFLASELIDKMAGLSAALILGVLALSPSVLGFAAHATQFVVPPALAGTLALLYALRSGRGKVLMASGCLFGISFLMKQPAMFFVGLGGLAILLHYGIAKPARLGRVIKSLVWYGVGVSIPVALCCAVFLLAGAFDEFWFWCFVYPSKYGTALPVSAAFQIFPGNLKAVMGSFTVLWILAGVGVVLIPFYKRLASKRRFLFLFACFSFLAVTPGFYFRSHYFVVVLPAVAVLVAMVARFAEDLFLRSGLSRLRLLPTATVVFIIVLGVFAERSYYFDKDPGLLSRSIYGGNPFKESIRIAQMIEAGSVKEDRIAILGSEPQIYFYAKRKAASSHIFTYPLVESHEFARTMQEEMIRDIEGEEPKYIVYVNVGTSWMVTPKSDQMIFEWFSRYSKERYVLEGLVEILSADRTDYFWDEEARNHTARTNLFVTVHRRKDT